MAEKELKARLVQKHDIEVNWIKATEFIPKKGEIIVYDIESTDGETLLDGVSLPSDEEHKRTTPYTYERFKIGDGKHKATDLPFTQGEKGEKGDSGVYIGTDIPPADVNVWIDPSGEDSTEEIVNAVIASLPTWTGGSY